MQSNEIRTRFIKFFEKRGHAVILSASLVPQNDPSVLFNTAGMQPLAPYLLGEKHPLGNRLVNIQKCVRTVDLDDVGDNRHFSFFEMMGNWSLGDYFKKEAITWSYEFLTSKEEGLGLNPDFLYITIFEGDDNAPLDEESKKIWMSLGIAEHRIYTLPADGNWWSPGDNGPCGPCSEMFYDMENGVVGDLSKEEFIDAVKEERIVEIWNDVFMEYEKKNGKVIGKLKQKNVDTGAGLERMTAVMQGKKTAYETDIFLPIMEKIKNFSQNYEEKSARIVADHIRTSIFLIADGVIPANKDRGYILRRLIRRAVRHMDILGLPKDSSLKIIEIVKNKYTETHANILQNYKTITDEIIKEENKFRETLERGLKEFEKGIDPFVLATTYGFPLEMTLELAKEKRIKIDIEDFHKKMEEHQKLSQTASVGMFKGGLADTSDATIKLHTAHHLLLAALQKIVSHDIHQRGSNITSERLRMDFSFDRKLTDEEKKKVEDQVNEWISMKLPVVRREMSRTEAEKLGAEMEFGVKYPEIVSLYFIGPATMSQDDIDDGPLSIEFCGGPHVTNTGDLGIFKIQKEEASSAGVRRIKAVLT
ncbi:hypothetical protein A2997_00190 [Candidatus Nomurabacteria bacterium RIFCSPLOWO2_01_FULL_36_10b]|uniref:alanine--tRNA ligase n=1 Tax=Candidatus Nomurabacteria bacterium RIFCSPLOWO2_01_FULL_36_10b TaxID=1801766 RepID=A0A1F6WMZ2_9BACT|nr:MAG: hypothetical protein A2997_00190 [Candidatus Nomurabacteria bacterium RIFCSPLOWO2_01_FULL_36_10b]